MDKMSVPLDLGLKKLRTVREKSNGHGQGKSAESNPPKVSQSSTSAPLSCGSGRQSADVLADPRPALDLQARVCEASAKRKRGGGERNRQGTAPAVSPLPTQRLFF